MRVYGDWFQVSSELRLAMLFIARLMLVLFLVACGEDECPRGSIMGPVLCKWPEAGKAGSESGRGGFGGRPVFVSGRGAGGKGGATSQDDAGVYKPPAELCGNGIGDEGETCDHNCSEKCEPRNACFTAKVYGSLAACDLRCEQTEITKCIDGDGCCADGCNHVTDNDCDPVCGDGEVSGAETCDGNCPTCDDGNPCTVDIAGGTAAACSLTCKHQNVTAGEVCGDGLRCDSSGGCNVAYCGDGIVDSNERCDGNCPTTCEPAAKECVDNALVDDACQTRCESKLKPEGTICYSNRGACDNLGECIRNIWYMPCKDQAACGNTGTDCHSHICTVECTDDSQCGSANVGPAGRCLNGLCERHCSADADCWSSQVCVNPGSDGVCRAKPCSGAGADSECPKDFFCQSVGGEPFMCLR